MENVINDKNFYYTLQRVLSFNSLIILTGSSPSFAILNVTWASFLSFTTFIFKSTWIANFSLELSSIILFVSFFN